MGLFNFGKKKEVSCGCKGNCEPTPEIAQDDCGGGTCCVPSVNTEKEDTSEEMAMCDCGSVCKVSDIEAKAAENKKTDGIKVLGPGCKKCTELENNVKEALSQMGENIEIQHVTDFASIASYGVISTPALVIDSKVVSVGKVLKTDEVVKIITKHR